MYLAVIIPHVAYVVCPGVLRGYVQDKASL